MPTSSCAPSPISFSARARAVSTFELGVAVHNIELGQAERFKDRRGDIGATLAILADRGLEPGLGQQHADFERAPLGADDRGCRDRGQGGGRALEHAAAAQAYSNAIHKLRTTDK